MLQFGIPELPERISVESKYITLEEAVLNNLNYLDLRSTALSSHGSNQVQIPSTTFSHYSNNGETIPMLPMVKTFVDAEILTDGPNPMRDRIIQTEKMNSVTIGLQCNLEQEMSDLEFNKAFQIVEATTESLGDFKKRFIDFVKNNTNRFDNGYFECILCGEIKPNAKLTAAHLSVHFGPPKLCSRCGIYFDHKILWKKHNCIAKRTKNKKRLIKCPHYSCGVHAVSPGELFDHLNEHCATRQHQCSCCNRQFLTTGELHLHRKLHKKCNTIKNNDLYSSLPIEDKKCRKRTFIVRTTEGKRMLIKTFLSQASRRFNHKARLCCVCLMRCKNAFHYQRHMQRCLLKYRRRLKLKRNLGFQTAKPIVTNGCNGEHID